MLFTEEDKTFIKIFVLDMNYGYGLRKLMTESPEKNKKVWIG